MERHKWKLSLILTIFTIVNTPLFSNPQYEAINLLERFTEKSDKSPSAKNLVFTDMNDRSEMVGFLDDGWVSSDYRPFTLHLENGVTFLPSIPYGIYKNHSLCVSPVGLVVGTCEFNSQTKLFVWPIGEEPYILSTLSSPHAKVLSCNQFHHILIEDGESKSFLWESHHLKSLENYGFENTLPMNDSCFLIGNKQKNIIINRVSSSTEGQKTLHGENTDLFAVATNNDGKLLVGIKVTGDLARVKENSSLVYLCDLTKDPLSIPENPYIKEAIIPKDLNTSHEVIGFKETKKGKIAILFDGEKLYPLNEVITENGDPFEAEIIDLIKLNNKGEILLKAKGNVFYLLRRK